MSTRTQAEVNKFLAAEVNALVPFINSKSHTERLRIASKMIATLLNVKISDLDRKSAIERNSLIRLAEVISGQQPRPDSGTASGVKKQASVSAAPAWLTTFNYSTTARIPDSLPQPDKIEQPIKSASTGIPDWEITALNSPTNRNKSFMSRKDEAKRLKSASMEDNNIPYYMKEKDKKALASAAQYDIIHKTDQSVFDHREQMKQLEALEAADRQRYQEEVERAQIQEYTYERRKFESRQAGRRIPKFLQKFYIDSSCLFCKEKVVFLDGGHNPHRTAYDSTLIAYDKSAGQNQYLNYEIKHVCKNKDKLIKYLVQRIDNLESNLQDLHKDLKNHNEDGSKHKGLYL